MHHFRFLANCKCTPSLVIVFKKSIVEKHLLIVLVVSIGLHFNIGYFLCIIIRIYIFFGYIIRISNTSTIYFYLTLYIFSISAQHLLEIAQHSQNVQDLASAINESDLEMFLFPDDFMTKLFDILR